MGALSRGIGRELQPGVAQLSSTGMAALKLHTGAWGEGRDAAPQSQ